jgi:gliding motility-associated-like protein
LFLFSLSLDGYCLSRLSPCSVSAGYFPANDTVVSTGSPLFFENQSSNAGSFSWFLNGSFISSQRDLTLIPTLGVNEIMLVATDGICSDTSFSFIIWDGVGMNAYGNFQKQYHPAGMAMEPFCMGADQSGGYLLAGDFFLPSANNFISKTTALFRIDEKGCVSWAKAMISGEVEVIQSIISTRDSGWLISAFPYQSQQNNYPNFLIISKLDKSGNREWSHSYSNGSIVNNYYSAICETADGGFALEIGSFPVAGSPSFISAIKIDPLGRFVWGKQLSIESDAFYNVGGILEKNQFLFVTGSVYDADPPYDLIRSFLVQLNETDGETIWSKKNDPVRSPVSFTDIHPWKNGLLINSFSGSAGNHFLYSDTNGNLLGGWAVDNAYGSQNGKENIIVTPDNGIYFHQASGNATAGYKDIIMRMDSNLQIRWQYDFSAQDLNYTGWFQLAGAPDFGVSGIGSGLLPNGFNAMTFMKTDSAGSGCHSGNTNLQLVPEQPAIEQLNWNTDQLFTMQVTDLPLTLNEIPFESELFCPKYLSGCDLLKLEGPAQVCRAGDTIQYKLHLDSHCAEPVTWSYDRESISTVDSSGSGRSFRFVQPGEFIIKVQKNGCNTRQDSMMVSVGDAIPKINLPLDTVLCAGSVMKLDAGAGYADYRWQDGSDKESINVQQVGIYWVKLTGISGCIYTDTTIIRSVEPPPFAFLPSDTVVCAGESWELKPARSFKTYAWSTGESSGSIQISNAGLYSLQVVDANGCAGADTIHVETKKCAFGIYFPNAFTPNKDGLNDIFKPVIVGKTIVYKLSIYNRWGQLVFETTDPGTGWNGTINNADQPGAAYIWTCTYQFYGQETMNRRGNFVLLR